MEWAGLALQRAQWVAEAVLGDAGGAPEGRLQADGAGVVPLGGGGDELVAAPRAATTTMAMDEGQSLAQVQVVERLAREAAWRAVDARAEKGGGSQTIPE